MPVVPSVDTQSALAACLQLARAIVRTDRIDELYDASLDALTAALRVNRASILLFDPDGVMRFKAWRGLSQTYRRAVEGHTPWKRGEARVDPIVVGNVAEDAGLDPYLTTIRAEQIEAMAFIPLEGTDGVIGKFMLYYAEPHHLSPEELHWAGLIAAQVAFAMELKQTEMARALASERSHDVSQRLAAIVESSDDAIISRDLTGVIQSWNRGAERMYGYSSADAIGQSIDIIVPPDRRIEDERLFATVCSGAAMEMETVRRHKDGTLVPVSLVVSPVKDADGRIVGAAKIAREIGIRKRQEAEQAELHRRLTALVDASASLLHSLDSESVRSATLTLAQQLLRADGYALWATDADDSAWRPIRTNGVSEVFAGRVVRSRGNSAVSALSFSRPLPVENVASEPLLHDQLDDYRAEGIQAVLVCPMRLHGGRAGTLVFYYREPHTFNDSEIQAGQALANIAAAAMTTADLYDEQREQRRAAESARQQAAFLAEATAVLSRSLDVRQTLTAVANLAVPEIADWCAVDIVENGRLRRLAVTHVDPRKMALADVFEERYDQDPDSPAGPHAVIRSGEPQMIETITPEMIDAYSRHDGYRRVLRDIGLSSYMCVPLIGTTGTFGAITFLFAESRRHYSARDLIFAQDVAARAALAIENATAYRQAREANQLKDEFLATLSHELRTPLNAILGYAQMLELKLLSGDRHTNAIAALNRNAEALKQIIGDVLDVSRITSGKLRLNVQPIELAGIAKNALTTVQPAADAKRVSVRLVVAKDVPLVSGDPDRLQQVVWNLLSNAVKFTSTGGEVQVRLDALESAAQLVVTDNGKGIDSEFLPHIFERFRQADSRFSREHGGLGLGLAIAKELIELHGGTIAAFSDGSGTGATFTVQLPAIPAPKLVATYDSSHLLAAGNPTDLSNRLTGIRVLAVDDEEDARELLKIVLEGAGAAVTTAESAFHALELLERDVYDVLLADIGMPRMDGLQLIEEIRRSQLPTASRMPALALTAFARAEDRKTALAKGFQRHVAKPVQPTELVFAVAELVQQ